MHNMFNQDANNHALVAEVDSHAVGLLSTSSEIDISVLQAREIAPRSRDRAEIWIGDRCVAPHAFTIVPVM